MTIHVGLLVFPDVQQLDVLGPHDLLTGLPGVKTYLVWKTLDTIKSSSGLPMSATTTLADCPPLDVLVVPGGGGINSVQTDLEVVAWVQKQAQGARYVTSVCTGTFLLGVAGLLKGRKATTHWRFHDLLSMTGAIPTKGRVVRDEPKDGQGYTLLTGGGVTAGIDFALTLASDLVGPEAAQAAQLYLEYAPAPPFNSGDPSTAPPEVLNDVLKKTEGSHERRLEILPQAMKAAADLPNK